MVVVDRIYSTVWPFPGPPVVPETAQTVYISRGEHRSSRLCIPSTHTALPRSRPGFAEKGEGEKALGEIAFLRRTSRTGSVGFSLTALSAPSIPTSAPPVVSARPGAVLCFLPLVRDCSRWQDALSLFLSPSIAEQETRRKQIKLRAKRQRKYIEL